MEKFDLQRRRVGKWARRSLSKRLLKNGIWFVDIPRTSSTAVKTKLGELYGPDYGKRYDRESAVKTQNLIADHTPALKFKRLVGREIWDQLYTFSFVRNPWARFYSIYRFRMAAGGLPASLDFETYVKKLEAFRFRDPESPYVRHEFHYPMLDYLMDESEHLLVSEWFKVEERPEAIERIKARTGLDLESESREVLCSPDEYRSAYSESARQIVSRFYADDIRYFDYEF